SALGFKLADLLQYLIQPQAVGIGHRPTTLGREAVTEAVNTVDILGALGKAFIENACTLVDQRQNAALHDFLITHVTLGVAGFLGHFASHHVGFGVMDRLTAARLVAVEAMAALLTETTHLAQAVVQPHNRLAAAHTRQLTGAPAQVHTDNVIHAVRAHGHAETLQRLVDLPRRGPFEHHLTGLTGIHGQHAVADEAMAVASQHRFLADLLANR